MLTKRIIPCLDVMEGKVVKGIHFKNLRHAGDPAELAALYDGQGADEIVFLDIGASPKEREIMAHVVERTADQVFIPLTVGGGLRTINDVRKILQAGADKVSINTAAVQNPKIIQEAATKFGSQCIVVAIDAKKVRENRWMVYIYGGRKRTELDAVKWAKNVERLGAGEILLTSMDTDGTQKGYDIPLTNAICNVVNIPIIASGGAGNIGHIYEVFTKTDASAALAASIFHYGKYTVQTVKEKLNEKNIPVRLD